MSIISALVLFVLALSMVVTAVLLVNSVKNNFQTGQLVRKQIGEKINELRFGQMLEKHGVNTQSFLHKVSLTEIDSKMRSCQSCLKTTECDKTLQNQLIDGELLQFCPNSLSFIAQQN